MSDQNSTVFGDDDDFDAFDASDDGGGLPGLFVLVAGVLVLLTFSAVVWVAYQQGLRQGGRDAPPVVVADPGPIKVPAREESEEQLAQREVFDRLDADAPQRTEQLAALPEEPVERGAPANRGVTSPITASATREEEGAARGDVSTGAGDAAAPVAAPVAAPAAASVAAPAPADVQPNRARAANAGSNARPQASDGLVEIPPPPRNLATNGAGRSDAGGAASSPAAPATNIGASAVAAEDSFVVQLASFRSQEEATTSWGRMQTRFPELMTQVRPDIQRADLGERGIYYRLRVGFFSDKARADAFCAELSAAGQSCLVRRR